MYSLNGFFTGVFAILLVEAFVVYRLFYQQQQPEPTTKTSEAAKDGAEISGDSEKLKESENETPNKQHEDFTPSHQKWPPKLRQYLQTFLPGESQPAEILTSSNVLIHRFFIEARDSPIFHARLRAKLMEKIGSAGGLVSSVSIDEVSLGDSAPIVDSINLLGSEALDVIFECGLMYEGGICVRITTLLNIGIRIPVSVRIGRIQGRFQIRIPSPHDPNMFAVAFTTDPGLELLVESSLWRRDNEMLKDVLNSLIAKRLRNAFQETLVLPNWRSFSLPLLTLRQPDVEILRLMNPDDIFIPTSPLDQAGSRLRNRRGVSTKNGPTSLVLPTLERSDSAEITLPKRRVSVSQISDCLTSKCFPVNSVVTSQNAKEYGQMLLAQFIKISVTDQPSEKSFQDAWTSSNWENVRTKKSITIQKKSIFINKNKAELHKAFFDVKCPADKTFQVLSNPEHWRHTEDWFSDSVIVESYGEYNVRKFTFRIGRGDKNFYTLEVKSKVQHDGQDAYAVVYRSVRSTMSTNSSPLPSATSSSLSIDQNTFPNLDQFPLNSNDGIVFVLGYMILPTLTGSRVIILSQFDGNAVKLNPTVQRCSRIKMFVEELAEWSILVEKSTGPKETSSFGSETSKVSGERLRNVWNLASNVIKAGRSFATRRSGASGSHQAEVIPESSELSIRNPKSMVEEQIIREEEEEGMEGEEREQEQEGKPKMARARSLSEPSKINFQ